MQKLHKTKKNFIDYTEIFVSENLYDGKFNCALFYY